MLRCPPVEQVATTFFYLITFSTSRDEAKVSLPLKQALSPLVNFFSQLTLPRGDKKRDQTMGLISFLFTLLTLGGILRILRLYRNLRGLGLSVVNGRGLSVDLLLDDAISAVSQLI